MDILTFQHNIHGNILYYNRNYSCGRQVCWASLLIYIDKFVTSYQIPGNVCGTLFQMITFDWLQTHLFGYVGDVCWCKLILMDIKRWMVCWVICTTMAQVGKGNTCWQINSLAPGRPGCHFKTTIFNLNLLIGIFTSSKDNALRWMPRDLTDDKSTLVQ